MTSAAANARLLLSIAVVIAAARGVGWMVSRVGQPRVLGEIAAGIVLGPSLLGLVWPAATAYLFPEEVLAGVRAVAQVGLVLFMFLVGLDLDPSHLRGQGRRALVISHTSIVLPFVLGAGAAWWLHPSFGGDSPALAFSLFMGIAMSITAFPVLARILQESGLDRTRIGALTLTCAAIDDVTAWCGLAAVIAVAESTGWVDAVVTLAATVGFVAAMLAGVRPVLARLGGVSVPTAVAFALICAWTTEVIGIHAIFGAFLAGFVVRPAAPEDRGAAVTRLKVLLEPVATTVLLPVFFAVVGLSTRFGVLDSVERWLVLGLVIAVAIAGKLGGSAVAARVLGETWRDSLTVGVLMNTRGLTELVILTVGLDLGVIDETMFTIMVMMALVTTFMAGPVLRLLSVGGVGADPNDGSGGRGTPALSLQGEPE